jgi:hypothetical protein
MCCGANNCASPGFYYWGDYMTAAPEAYKLKDTHYTQPGEGQLGAWTPFGFFVRAENDAIVPLRINGSFYVEVTRQSMPVEYTGSSNIGWWHFEARGSGMYLKVEGRVMDYTCPRWLLEASNHDFIEIKPMAVNHGLEDDPNTFTKSFRVQCIHNWCTPVDCEYMHFNGSFIDGNPNPAHFWNDAGVYMNILNRPAYWKWDPPFWQHHLHTYDIALVLSFWPGLRNDDWQWVNWGTSGPKMVIDYRNTNVTRNSYSDGGVHNISCPQDTFSHYFVNVNGVMEKCICNSRYKFLNCDQLSSLQVLAPPKPAARVVCHYKNGTLYMNKTTCSFREDYKSCISLFDSDPKNAFVLYPPHNTTACGV